ncbi:MAG: CBS domain-containing protein [Syntrophobacteraceae bacterium]
MPAVSIGGEESLSDALEIFLETGYDQIPIIDPDIGVIGMLRLEDILTRYHHEVQKQ